MKGKDWAFLILVVGIASLVSFAILNQILPNPDKNQETVPTAVSFSSQVKEPSKEIFNDDAINPAITIEIGNQGRQAPFKLNSDD